ncbi:MAG: hypothetical protein ACQES9_01395 [Myxococcota bacterium]
MKYFCIFFAINLVLFGCDDSGTSQNNINNANNENNFQCEGAEKFCNGKCTDLSTDPDNCGSCNNKCGFDEFCQLGECIKDCGDLINCDNTCVDIDTDTEHCGSCNNSCPNPNNILVECDEGECHYQCKTNYADCNQDLDLTDSDGCEVNLVNDDEHCGYCGLDCGNFAKCINQTCQASLELEAPCSQFSSSDPYCLGSDRKTVFRFRSPVNISNSWQSSGVWSGNYNPVTYSRGSGLTDFIPSQFDGSSAAFTGSSIISVQETGFTISVLFSTDTNTGIKSLVSTTENWQGYSFKIDNGQLRALVRVRDGSDTVQYELYDPNIIPVDTWVYAHMQVAVIDANLRVRIYRDGYLVTENNFPVLDGLFQSASYPCVGAEPTDNIPDSGFFEGMIYSLEIRNWPVAHRLLITPQFRDGGRYLGRPSYHDYLTTTHDFYRRLENTLYHSEHPELGLVNNQFGIPYLNDNYLPQGFAVHPETGNLFMAYYYKDTDGNNPGNYPSLIVEGNPDSAEIVRVLRLYHSSGSEFTYHMGGIAVAGNNLYVASAGKIFRFSLNQAQLELSGNSGQGPDEYSLMSAEDFIVSSSSFLDVNPEEGSHGAIYAGEFVVDGAGIVKRYDLPADGSLASIQLTDEFTLPVSKVQGAAAFISGGSVRFLLTTSYGDAPSSIYLWDPATDDMEHLACLPAGLEDLDLRLGQIWTWFENGGKYFQKRSANSWYTLYPYIVMFDQEELISNLTAVSCSDYQ